MCWSTLQVYTGMLKTVWWLVCFQRLQGVSLILCHQHSNYLRISTRKTNPPGIQDPIFHCRAAKLFFVEQSRITLCNFYILFLYMRKLIRICSPASNRAHLMFICTTLPK
jgi:hypothetical protein